MIIFFVFKYIGNLLIDSNDDKMKYIRQYTVFIKAKYLVKKCRKCYVQGNNKLKSSWTEKNTTNEVVWCLMTLKFFLNSRI